MDEYNDWRKEVDKQTIRTTQKIEHFKRSEELLKAIQERINSANTRESQQELQDYLMAKLGYKNSQYTDFVSNQMIQEGEEAKAEAKRTAMLRANQSAIDFIKHNNTQVRDSVTLGSKHAYTADHYIPSSAADVLGFQEERKLMTQKEFAESRQRDFEYLQEKRLLWNEGPDRTMSNEDHEFEYRLRQLGKVTDEQDSVIQREALKQIDRSVLEQARPQELYLNKKGGIVQQMEKIKEDAEATRKRKSQIAAQRTTAVEEGAKVFDELVEELNKCEQQNPDEINTDDLTYSSDPDISISEGEKQMKLRKIEQFLDQDNPDEAMRVSETQNFYNNAYDSFKPSNLEDLRKSLEGEGRQETIDIIKTIQEIESLSEKESELEKENEHYTKISPYMPQDFKDDVKQEKDYIFFKETQLYEEWASDVLRQSTQGMSAEEAAKLHEVQEMIRDSIEPTVDLGKSVFDYTEADFNKLKGKDRYAAMQKAGNHMLKTTQDGIPDLDYGAGLQKVKGTDEGKRRYERIDRVSQDAGRDGFEDLKLLAKHDRIYDDIAAQQVNSQMAVLEKATDLNPYIKETLQIKTQGKGRNETKKAYLINEKEQFVRQKMPLGLTKEERDAFDKREDEREKQFEMDQQLAQAEGKVQRKHYAEDVIHSDKASEMVNQQPFNTDFEMANKLGLISQMEEQYGQARELESQILAKRMEVAAMMRKSQQKLDSTMQKHDRLIKVLKSDHKSFEFQILTENGQHLDRPLPKRNPGEPTINPEHKPFSPDSTKVRHYERELKQISQLGLHKTVDQRDMLLQQFEFVFGALDKNRLPLTPLIRGHMFEYLALRNDFELANNQLKFLTDDRTEYQSPVDSHYLQLYLTNCLKHDKIDGVAYLTNFMQRYNVDSSSMPINKFHSMLDYYLNHNFDLSKVMIFLKFYRQFYFDTVAKILPDIVKEKDGKVQQPGTLEDDQIKMIQERVFSPHDSLVDMRALSKFLVRKTAGKQIVDPFTREDTLQGLIDLFTHNPDVYQASSLSKNNHIEPATIAEYFGHRLTMPDSLERVMKVALRLNNTQAGREFAKEMLKELKQFQAKRRGELPASFNKQALKDLYLKVRASEQTLSSHTAELLLYAMHTQGLHGEVIDLCERMGHDKEIAKYYLSESLLSLPLKSGSYAAELGKTGAFNQKQGEMTAMEITQRTKAVMLDDGPKAAFDFFKSEFQKLEEKAQQKKAFLVSLYDTLMPSDEDLTFEEFVERYRKSSNLAARLAREAFVINRMEEILKDKNYQEIEDMINLYAVIREQRLMIQDKKEYVLDNDQEIRKFKNRAIEKSKRIDLEKLHKRRKELEEKVGIKDALALEQIANVMKDDELKAFSEADQSQIKSIAPIFADMTQEEAAAIETRNKEVSPNLLTRGSIIATLTSKGHEQKSVEKYYNLLDFNVKKFEYRRNRSKLLTTTNLMLDMNDEMEQKRAIIKEIGEDGGSTGAGGSFVRTPAIEVSQEDKAKEYEYDKLSKAEKEELKEIQVDYKRHVKRVIASKISPKEVAKIINDIEADPANKIRDRHLRADFFDHFESQSISEEDVRDNMSDDEIRRTEKLQQRYIKKLEDRYPGAPVQDLFAAKNIDSLSEDEIKLGSITGRQSQKNKEKEFEDLSALHAAKLGRLELEAALKEIGFYDKENDGDLDPVLASTIFELMQQYQKAENVEMFLNREQGSSQEGATDQEPEYLSIDENVPDEEKYVEEMKQMDELNEQWEEVKESFDTHMMHVTDTELSEQEDKIDDKAIIRKLWENIKNTTEYFVDQRIQELPSPKIDEVFYKDKVISMMQTQKFLQDNELADMAQNPTGMRRFNQEGRWEKFRDSLTVDPIGPEHMEKDPEVLQATIHDASIFYYRTELLDAINKRKFNVLPTMIKLFNNIQRKEIGKKFRLDDFESQNIHDYTILNKNKTLEVSSVEVNDAGRTIQKLDLLLHDSRSPLISTLMDTGKYKEKKLPEDPKEHYGRGEDWVTNPVDVGAYQRDVDKLDALIFEMRRIEQSLEHIDEKMKQQNEYVDKSFGKKKHLRDVQSGREISEKNLERLQQLYMVIQQNKGNKTAINDEYKVKVMRDILTLELGKSFDINAEAGRTASQFPAFYALDLINFGIKRSQPAAIRLGEKLLSESCPPEHAQLPQELAMSIKNYMLDYHNNMQYREAMKISGPLNSTVLYHMSAQKTQTEGMTLCLDDPYWQEFMQKNRRREDLWRNPSIFAYRYKQYGMLGEIMDMHSIQKRYDEAFNRPY